MIKAKVVESYNSYGSFEGYIVVKEPNGPRLDHGVEPHKTAAAARRWVAANYEGVELTGEK